ncbi:MAG: response regulator [Pseudomonadota bacterium]
MKARVLIVDDETKFVDYLRKRMENRGLTVSVASNGEEALQTLSEQAQDVVVLDVLMPGMDGIATLREIKKRDALVEVIMLTGHASVESAIDGMKLGAYDYLMKPCEIDDLVDKIRKAFARKTEHEERIQQARIKELSTRRGL